MGKKSTKKTNTKDSSLSFIDRDPFYKREAERYDDPIPSREYVLQILFEAGKPLSLNQLINALGLKGHEIKIEALNFRLKAMLRDGQMMQDRRGRLCLFQKINLKRGKVVGHPDGFGFFIPDDDSGDLVLSPREMRAVMHGDIVLAFKTGVDRRGRSEGKVHEIVEHANPTVVGRYFTEHGVGFVVPDSKRLPQNITVPEDESLNALEGQIVLVEIVAYPTKNTQAVGKITKILGEHMDPGMEIEVAILAHGLPHQWPEELIDEIKEIPKTVKKEELKGRADLRELNFVTIDGEDAKDFDDAVYCVKKPKGGFQLYVAIADVSHYVKPDSLIDKEAQLRGNSVYFPGKVVPMLPEALSNEICSLNPNVDRLAVVAEMSISDEGKVTRSRFYRAVIHSKARLTYTLVNNFLTKADNSAIDNPNLLPCLENLYDLFKVLLKVRIDRGAMDFETIETQIEFDENRKIKRILPVIRNDAHKLIEECMLAANMSAAKFLQKAEIPALYRVHAAPDEDKIIELRAFLSEFGLVLGGGNNPTPKDFQKTLFDSQNRPEKHLIQTVMLRSLKQAQYIESNDGHFGLAYLAYTHFTSPIRRYPDLLIHRAICHLIDKQEINEFDYDKEAMNTLGKHCSMTERRADEATREVVAWLKCEFMQDKLGQIFKGKISAVTGFGIFVELDEIYVEGLVHITSLKNDYYTFDSQRHRLYGERTGKIYRLGDTMTVQVARVQLDERKIDFEPIEENSENDNE